MVNIEDVLLLQAYYFHNTDFLIDKTFKGVSSELTKRHFPLGEWT